MIQRPSIALSVPLFFARACAYISERIAILAVILFFMTVSAFAAGAKDSGASDRIKAAHRLAAKKDPQAKHKITDQIRTEQNGKVRAGMIDALAAVDGKNSISVFQAELGHEDPLVRLEAVQAIGANGGKAGVPLLHSVLRNDKNTGVRMAAAFWLGGLKDASSISVLGQALKNDPEANVRVQAAQSLKLFKASSARSELRKGKDDPNETVRKIAND